MLKIYGSMLCPDCVQCCKMLSASGISYEFYDFANELLALKTFLSFRDSSPVFDDVKTNGKIGIPCIVDENNQVTLEWEQFCM